MPLILPGNVASALGGGYEVANSCRFNDGDTPYMHKTNGSTGSQTTWTFSCWVKRGALGTQQDIFACLDDTSNYTHLRIKSDDTVELDNISGGSNTARLTTNRKLRDVGAWYNLVWVADTTNGTAGDRIRLYINGTEETSFGQDTQPSSSAALHLNQNKKHTLGRNEYSSGSSYFDGYLAEVCFIDGTALTATSFGEFDEDSPTIWKPKDVSGLTFGTNGFYLDFEDSSNLGNDANGGTDFTEVNLAATDQSTDTPTNNFCTINPLDKSLTGTAATYSEGNLRFSSSGNSSSNNGTRCTFGASNGKWYWEVLNVQNAFLFGIQDADAATRFTSSWTYDLTGTYAVKYDGEKSINATETGSAISTFTDDDILMMAMDLDNQKLYFGKNGTWDNSGDPTSGATGTGSLGDLVSGTTYIPVLSNAHWSQNTIADFNFGSPSYTISSGNADGNGYGNFEYAVPSGYYALCTKNLAEFGG